MKSVQAWETPQLILLGRGTPEERVLGDLPAGCSLVPSDAFPEGQPVGDGAEGSLS